MVSKRICASNSHCFAEKTCEAQWKNVCKLLVEILNISDISIMEKLEIFFNYATCFKSNILMKMRSFWKNVLNVLNVVRGILFLFDCLKKWNNFFRVEDIFIYKFKLYSFWKGIQAQNSSYLSVFLVICIFHMTNWLCSKCFGFAFLFSFILYLMKHLIHRQSYCLEWKKFDCEKCLA